MAPNAEKPSVVTRELMKALPDGPARPNDSWSVFWGKMRQAGWKLKLFNSGDILLKELYIPPTGKPIENGGEKGIDYFTSVDDVKRFAIDHLGWEDPAPDRQQMLINEAKERMANIVGTPVQYGDNWLNVKEKMKHTGWKWNIPAPRIDGIPIGRDDFVYLLPGGRKPKEGGRWDIDFLEDEMAARKFAVDHFNWCGDFDGIDENSSSREGTPPPLAQDAEEDTSHEPNVDTEASLGRVLPRLQSTTSLSKK